MTTVAVRQDNSATIATSIAGMSREIAATIPGTDPVRSLAEWVTELEAAHRIGAALAPTQIVPSGLRDRPDDCAAVILVGATLKLAPTTALQSMHVVNGRVGMSTNLMIALLRRAGHDIWTEEQTDERATVAGRRGGWPADRVERITITIDQARKAGWVKKSDRGTSPWDNPSDMLYYRAASRVCKKVAPEALHGIPSAEDVEDAGPIRVEATVEAPAAPALTGADIIAQAKATAPAEQAEQKPAPEPERVSPKVSKQAVADLYKALKAVGETDKDAARTWVASEVLGRPLTTFMDLTVAEMPRVLAAIDERQRAQQADAEQNYDDQAHDPAGEQLGMYAAEDGDPA